MYQVMEEFMTIQAIIDKKASIGRYGDGEFRMTMGASLKFQKADKHLQRRLREVLQVNDPRFFVGIPRVWGRRDLLFYDPIKHDNWLKTMGNPNFTSQLDPKRQYYSALITRPDAAVHLESEDYHNLCRKLWAGKRVLYIRGDESKSFKAIERGFLSESKELVQQIEPSVNAWQLYDKIMGKVLNYNPNVWLVLLSLGPTATVMAYDLFKKGYQALDLGHLPMFWAREHHKSPKFIQAILNKYEEMARSGQLPDSVINAAKTFNLLTKEEKK